MVYRSKQGTVGCGRLHVLVLFSGHSQVPLLLRRDLLRIWTRSCPAPSTIEADAVTARTLVDHRGVINVVDHRGIHVCDRAVIKIFAAAPVAAVEAHAWISETVVNPSIKTNRRSPISRMPKVEAFIERPVSRSPQKTDLRRKYPRAGNPEVTVVAIRPIAWLPDVAGSRTDRLLVHRQDWRGKADRNSDADLCLWF